MYVCMVITYIAEYMDQPGKVASPARGQADQEKGIFLCCSRSRLRIWSRETGSAVPSRVSLLILRTQTESDAYSRDSSGFLWWRPFTYYTAIRHRVSSEFIRSLIQLRTDGVHFRESAGTGGPVVLKVVSVTGAAISGFTMDQFIDVGLYFPTPTIFMKCL